MSFSMHQQPRSSNLICIHFGVLWHLNLFSMIRVKVQYAKCANVSDICAANKSDSG